MNTIQIRLPHVRIEPAAHDHLWAIIEAFKRSGRNISMARFLSDLILSQPIPNGNGHTPEPSELPSVPAASEPSDTDLAGSSS